jgi:hypothetical protein
VSGSNGRIESIAEKVVEEVELFDRARLLELSEMVGCQWMPAARWHLIAWIDQYVGYH